MSESRGQEQTRWMTTVIMSTALQYQHGVDNYSDHEISTVLQRQQHRVRYSESVESGSVIFPLSGIAFILSDTQDLLRTGEEEFSRRIQKFINIHRNSFLVLSAALHGPEEWSVMFRIQRRDLDKETSPSKSHLNKWYGNGTDGFTNSMNAALAFPDKSSLSLFLGSNLRVIPVHNPAETVKLMLTMAKITSKPQADDTRCKMEMTKAQIIEKSPVWKMLQEYQSHCN